MNCIENGHELFKYFVPSYRYDVINKRTIRKPVDNKTHYK